MTPSDIAARARAAQAQAQYFSNATAQANAAVAGPVTNPKPIIPDWLSQLPYPSTPAINPVGGGLFPQQAEIPMPQIGGLMDFNALALQLGGGQTPSMGANPMMNNLFTNFMANRYLSPPQNPGPRDPRATIGVRG